MNSRRPRFPSAPSPLRPDPDALAALGIEVARAHMFVPFDSDARSVDLAVADPLDPALHELGFRVGRRVRVHVAPTESIVAALAEVDRGEISRLADLLSDREDLSGVEDRATLERAAHAAPLVRLVDHLIAEAARLGASDIHFEPRPDALFVRLRVDGLLRTVWRLPASIRTALVSRLKVMAGMDISVRRRPQDGGMRVEIGDAELSLRVSTLPTGMGGEKTVIRLLDPGRAPSTLEELGLAREAAERLLGVTRAGAGVVLATGPTGSGKSSTLHALLHAVDRDRRNVVTLEDPVEYPLPGVTQVQIAPRAGLGFPDALRSVLRQDPDTIMVGEIRDAETASIAMAAAVTGHLVLSTLHTTDAPGALARLVHMGVPPYLVAGGVSAVIAQRLTRRVCSECGGRTRACDRCDGEGLAGRIGVFQLLVMDDALRDAVVSGASTPALRRLARDAGMGSLAEDARRKVAEGRTTAGEVASLARADPTAGRPCRACGRGVPADAVGCPWCGGPLRRVCRCGCRLEPGWRWCPKCRDRRSSAV